MRHGLRYLWLPLVDPVFGNNRFLQFLDDVGVSTSFSGSLLNAGFNIFLDARKNVVNNINSQFLGITVDSSLSWKNHIDGLMVKLSKACYATRSLTSFVSQESLRMIYYSYFHTVMSYGKIFWGNSCHSSNIFKLQKGS